MGWLSAIAIGWGGSALATLLFTEAFAAAYSNPDVVILLQKTQPLWAIGAAAVILGERRKAEFGVLVIPAVIGTYLLSFGWLSPRRGADRQPGQAGAVRAGSGRAVGRGHRLRPARPARGRAEHPDGAALLAGAAVPGRDRDPRARAAAAAHSAGASDWMRLVLLALGSGLLAMMLYYRGLRTTPAPVATIAELAFPATALVVNYIWLDATINGWQMAGFVLLWATIALLHRMPVRVPADAPLPAPA